MNSTSDEVEIDFPSLEKIVRDVTINDDAVDFIDSMEDMDYHEFVERVVSLLLQQKESSKNQIGYDLDTVNSMLESYEDEQKVARQNNRKRKKR